MATFDQLVRKFGEIDRKDITARQRDELYDGLKQVDESEINSLADAQNYLSLLRKFREDVAESDRFHGDNYPKLLNSLLSVGEDGLYSNNLRFIFELIQNVDDCEFPDPDSHVLDIHFDFNNNKIVLRYNESGFTPFNVFAITGIAEAAKNISAAKNQIGEKGIGFKSVFGVTDKVLIRSGWFSFELRKENFTIPIANYTSGEYCSGTEMTLFVPGGKSKNIYNEIKRQYCTQEALFSRNPLLFLNKLTTLKMYYDSYRSMEFHVTRSPNASSAPFSKEENVHISVRLRDYENGNEEAVTEEIVCTRYSHFITFSDEACKSRYGRNTKVGSNGGKPMILQAIFPHPKDLRKIKTGALYSFLPTQLKLTVPLVCHVPFKLDASREFVDPQNDNLWFEDSCRYFSELLNYAYQDWAQTVQNYIVAYLPGTSHSIFAENNGKEKCLSSRRSFRGEALSELPLFRSVSGNFLNRNGIFCFDSEEQIFDPERAYQLLAIPKELFLMPDLQTSHSIGIHLEKNIYQRLFITALHNPDKTGDILQYLDDANFQPVKAHLPTDAVMLTPEQIQQIMQHPLFASLFMEHGVQCVTSHKWPAYSILANSCILIEDTLYAGFKRSEAPKAIETYLNWCGGNCILSEIGEKQYFIGNNALVLSSHNPLASFCAFCYEVDHNDSFSVRMRISEISTKLNELSESEDGTANDYLRELRNNRLMGKDAIGPRQYRSYVELIVKAGASSSRFIQELLQNADDCEYDDYATPEFTLTQDTRQITTHYNETGFTRGNIRAITAIGESTKKYLFGQNTDKIGEKGVGFKSIFAVASSVQIHSGDYHFSLSDKAPTIPELLDGPQESLPGTKMEIAVKPGHSLPRYKESEILELCLCLRNLRRLNINKIQVKIQDTDDSRIIFINKKQYKFRRFIHHFSVSEEALKDRENGLRSLSKYQQITCYLPEDSSSREFPLYCGLPTKHIIKVPIVIDAPFMLTTSRETIDTSCSIWNSCIRAELYTALLEVMDAVKHQERYKVLRLLRFLPRRQGTQQIYTVMLFDNDSDYLNQYNFLSLVKSASILPTFDSNYFACAKESSAVLFPESINTLFRKGYFGSVLPSGVLDIPQDESFDSIKKAFAFKEANFVQYFTLLKTHASGFMENASLREGFYECLLNAPSTYNPALRDLPIIPVYGLTAGQTEYVSWTDDKIFVKKGCYLSDRSYYILNESILSKSMCEKLLDVNINEMNANCERNRYNDGLKEILQEDDTERIYQYLLSEFSKGAFVKYQSREILMGMKESIPLRNQLGQITNSSLFICEENTGYFQSEILLAVSVHDECRKLADYLKYPLLSSIYYQDICNAAHGPLTADDLEDLTDDYFTNRDDILRNFYWNDLLPDELVSAYGLGYLTMQTSQDDMNYEFPENPVANITALRQHVRKLLKAPTRILHEKIERTVLRGCDSYGNKFDLDSKDARMQTLYMYSPPNVHAKCFCQLCKKVKPYEFMEVNSITANPTYFFPQARIALCLECSKRFEAIRYNSSRLNSEASFISAIKAAKIGSEGYIDVPLIPGESVRFTAVHLAELQEILRANLK